MNKVENEARARKSARIKIIAAILVVAVVVGLVLVAVFTTMSDSVDYMSDNLGKYIEISPEIYKNAELDIPLLSYSDAALIREINKLLVDNKNKEALYKGANVNSIALTLGDVANIWYRGFTVDENGNETDVEYASNFFDSTSHQLELGSGKFIAGIEEALIGVIPSKTPKFEKITNGSVKAEQVVYVSYERFTPDGGYEEVTLERIDLTDPSVDQKYGSGFRRALITQPIGSVFKNEMIFRIGDDKVDTLYRNFIVEFATECEKEPISVNVTFPANYSEQSLRGKDVTFELYVNSAVLYDTPEWGEDFILNTLKVNSDELSEYEGDSTVQKYESKLRLELKASIEKSNKELIEDALWKYYTEKATVKRLPEDTVNRIYTLYYNDLIAMYKSYELYYESIDDFACVYFSLADGADWRAYIEMLAETDVTEKLVFYYIIREENLLPDDEEYQRLYNECVAEELEYYSQSYKTELEKCETDEEREELLAEIKAEMLAYYGEEYFRESVLYPYALDRLLEFVKMKNS